MRRKELPKRISPNPLLSSVVEIRFESNLRPDDLIGLYLNHFQKDFPDIFDHKPEVEIINARYKVKYIMHNDDFSILLGNDIIAFENRGDYKFWSIYFPLIQANLKVLNQACTIKKIDRIGIRYLSFFEGEFNLNNNILVENRFVFDDYIQKNSYFRAEYSKDNINIVIQVPQNVDITKENDVKKTGTVIDIDVSSDQELPQEVGDNLFKLINRMHTEEKAVFFTLLSDEFLNKLNPEWI